MKRPIRFGLTLDAATREQLDSLARLQGTSRTESITRAIHLLATVNKLAVRR